MLLLKPSQGLVKQPHLPFPSCSNWRLSRKRLRLWSWHQPESLLSRYAGPEVLINLNVSQTKAAYSGSSSIQGTLFVVLPATSITNCGCFMFANLLTCSAGSIFVASHASLVL